MGHMLLKMHGSSTGNEADDGAVVLNAQGGELPTNPAGSWDVLSNLGCSAKELILARVSSLFYEAIISHYGAC